MQTTNSLIKQNLLLNGLVEKNISGQGHASCSHYGPTWTILLLQAMQAGRANPPFCLNVCIWNLRLFLNKRLLAARPT